MMTTYIGNYEVYESGTVITTEDSLVKFTFDDLTISFKFETSEGGEMEVKRQIVSDKEAILSFVNFNSSLGCGNSVPYVLGTLKGRELSLLVRFSQLDKGGKTITYTWLLGGQRNG